MASILVTGSKGFIGSHLVPKLRAEGHDVIAVDQEHGDAALPDTWASFPDAEIVVHLAALSFVPSSWEEPARFLGTNVQGTVGALEFCRKRNARLIVLSSYLYGHPETLPVAETAPLTPTNPYALSKLLGEEVCRFYVAAFGVGVIILRPFNVYGPGQPEHFLLQTIIRQVLSGVLVQVKDLEPRRDYVYVGDLVRAIIAAVGSTIHSGVYNIGSGISHSVEDVIALVQSSLGTALPVSSERERRPDEIMDTVADISRARTELAWMPTYTFREGIRATLSASAAASAEAIDGS